MAVGKLEDLEITKVDVVDAGADQNADILIKKREPFYKRFYNRFCDAFGFRTDEVKKMMEARDFDETMQDKKTCEILNEVWDACMTLKESVASILLDKNENEASKKALVAESLGQFTEFFETAAEKWAAGEVTKSIKAPELDSFSIQKMRELLSKADDEELDEESEEEIEDEEEIEESTKKADDTEKAEDEEVEVDMRFDTEAMSPTEKAIFKSICDKYAVDEEEKIEKGAEEAHEETDVKKAVEDAVNELMKDVQVQIDTLQKSAEEKEMAEIAKRYEILGMTAEKTIPVLKSMKDSSEEGYQELVKALDAQADAVEKSGLFSEIGKRGNGNDPGNMTPDQAWSNIEKKAMEIMKDEPKLTFAQAADRVCMANPALVHACEGK